MGFKVILTPQSLEDLPVLWRCTIPRAMAWPDLVAADVPPLKF